VIAVESRTRIYIPVVRAMSQSGLGALASGLLSAVATKILAAVGRPAALATPTTLQQLRQAAVVGATGNGQTALVRGASALTGVEQSEFVRTVLCVFTAAMGAFALGMIFWPQWFAELAGFGVGAIQLEASIHYLAEHPETGMVHSSFVDVWETPLGTAREARLLRSERPLLLDRRRLFGYLTRYYDWPFHPSTLVMRREVWERTGPFDAVYALADTARGCSVSCRAAAALRGFERAAFGELEQSSGERSYAGRDC